MRWLDDQLAIVSAADDGYVMPLAVTIRSAAACLSPAVKLNWFILDGGVSDENRERLEQCFEPNRVAIDWVRADREALAGLPVSEHVTLATYFRILIPRLLPPWLEKVIYLDSDLVVLQDLNELWREPLGDHWCLAAQDMAAPYLDAERVLANFHQCARYLASPRPLPNYQELALDGRAKYFNAGVLVIDLARWRSAVMTGRLLGCLRKHSRHVLWWDQYALNVVLAGRWGELDPRWNQIPHIHAYPSWRESPFDEETFRRIVGDPFIVHYASAEKPWHYDNAHPRRDLFYHYLDQTPWAGWRPRRPHFLSAPWRRKRLDAWNRTYRRGVQFLKRRILRKSA